MNDICGCVQVQRVLAYLTGYRWKPVNTFDIHPENPKIQVLTSSAQTLTKVHPS